MQEDTKQKLLLMGAIFVTMLTVMQFMARKEQLRRARAKWKQQAAANRERAPVSGQNPAPAAGQAPPPSADKPPATVTQEHKRPAQDRPRSAAEARQVVRISVTRGRKGQRFQAVFSTRGAALTRFTLLDFYNHAKHAEGQEVRLLDDLGSGNSSLVVSEIDGKEARARNYELVSVPRDALLEPRSADTERNDRDELVMRTRINDWEVTRTYILTAKTGFGFIYRVGARNLAPRERALSYRLVCAAGIVPDDAGRWSPLEMMNAQLLRADPVKVEVFREMARQVSSSKYLIFPRSKEEIAAEIEILSKQEHDDPRGDICWAGLKNRFFTAVSLVDTPNTIMKTSKRLLFIGGSYKQAHPDIAQVLNAHTFSGEVQLQTVKSAKVRPGAAVEHGYRFYGGPADEKHLAFDPRLYGLVNYTWGIFNPISQYLVKLLDLLGGLVGNYGIAMILLTLILKSVLHPLTRKSLRSSHKMQQVAPLVKELQRKYKDQREKLHQEMMRLYREHGVSPMGGCLPMLVQLPIFFALYGAFARGFALRQATFVPGWIDDLAQPDSVWHWQTPLPVIGTNLSLLPIAYLIMQVIQMSMQPKSDDPQVQQQQKMMKVMPLMFVFIFYTMPSGLVLYFTVSSLYTLVEHWLIKRKLEEDKTAAGIRPGDIALSAKGGSAPAGSAGANGPAPAGKGIADLQAGKKKKKKRKR